jgi:hypothetical protein
VADAPQAVRMMSSEKPKVNDWIKREMFIYAIPFIAYDSLATGVCAFGIAKFRPVSFVCTLARAQTKLGR